MRSIAHTLFQTVHIMSNPTLVQELETALILKSLASGKESKNVAMHSAGSKAVVNTKPTVSYKRKLPTTQVHVSPVPQSNTVFQRSVSPGSFRDDRSDTQSISSFEEPLLRTVNSNEVSSIVVKPLSRPPKLRRVSIQQKSSAQMKVTHNSSSSIPLLAKDHTRPTLSSIPSFTDNRSMERPAVAAFSNSMIMQLLSNQMIFSAPPSLNSILCQPILASCGPNQVQQQRPEPLQNSPTLPQKSAQKSLLKVCRMEGCNTEAARRTPYCKNHSGQRRCEAPNCNKCAQGRTRFCIGHGGGRRCQFEGCTKGARDKKFCASHGGGRRCNIENCKKLAVGRGNTCTAHGGGRRCQHEECTKSAQSNSTFCVRHGGGRKCKMPKCNKVARGKQGLCMSHATQEDSKQTLHYTI